MKKDRLHTVDLLFTLTLFCLFAASALILVRIGAAVYGNTADALTQNFGLRTSLSYVAEKVRQNDTAGGVRLGELEGRDALVLEQEENGVRLTTWIYYDDGALKELYVAEGTTPAASMGQRIAELRDFEIREKDGLFTFTCTDEKGRSASVSAYPRSAAGEEAQP